MGATAEGIADAAVNAALNAAGISKAGGGVPVPVVRAMAEAMAQQIITQQAQTAETVRAAVKLAKRQSALIDRLAGMPDPDGPYKGTGLVVPFQPGQWDTRLVPRTPEHRNGHSHDS